MKKSSYEYRHYNHAVGLSVIHLVWIPKRRKKVLVGKIRDRIFEIFSALAPRALKRRGSQPSRNPFGGKT
jgi:putative transposase